MAELLNGHEAESAIGRLALQNPDVGEVLREIGGFLLGLDEVRGLNYQNPPRTYNLAFVLRDRGKGRPGAFVSIMTPSFRETGRWNDAPDFGTLRLSVYVDPEKRFPEEFRWLKDRHNRTVFNRGWVDGYVFSDRTNLTEAMYEIRVVAQHGGR